MENLPVFIFKKSLEDIAGIVSVSEQIERCGIEAFYDPKTFFTHAVLLRQGCSHCAIFPTAASRRSLDRVSVPVWLVILSDQLRIVGLVSHYLTNYLIRRGLLPKRINPLIRRSYAALATLSGSYSSLWGKFPRVTQPSAARRQVVNYSRCRSTCMC